jgi:oligo-1,6-glucosidase
VREGRFELLLADDPNIWAFTRTLEGVTILVVANFSSHENALPVDGLPELAGAKLLIGERALEGVTTLKPWESSVLELA